MIRLPLFVVLLGALTLTATRVHAQTRGLSLAGGYSGLRDLGSGATPAATYPRGWFVAGSHPIGLWGLEATGDLSRHARDQFGIQTTTLTAVLGGVRRPLLTRPRVRTFAQVLVGFERFAEPGFDDRGPAFQPGVGVDIGVARRVAARVQIDYRLTRMSGAGFREVRTVIGAVWSVR